MENFIIAFLVLVFFIVFVFKVQSNFAPAPAPVSLPSGAKDCHLKSPPFQGLQTFGTNDCKTLTHNTYSTAYPAPGGIFYCCN